MTTLEARRTRFDWSRTPLRWIPGDAHTAHVIDVLHLLLPTGERWFARVLHHAIPLIDDAELRAQVGGFIRQEAWHAHAHAEVVAHYKAHGVDMAPFIAKIEWLFDQLLDDEPLGREVPPRLERAWLDLRVAIIAAIEHYTAVLGAWALEADGLDAARADATMLDLIRWHAAEEIEHRAIAFDAARALGIGWLRRQLAYALVAPIFWYVWIAGTRFLARADPSPERTRPSWRRLYIATRRGRLPSVSRLARATLRYVWPGFHPLAEGSLERALAYLARSPAAIAAAS